MGGTAMSSVIARILRFPLTRIVLGVLFVAVPVTAMQIGPHGAFGVEASAVAVIACLIAFLLFILRAQRLGRIRAPFWRRRAATTVVTT